MMTVGSLIPLEYAFKELLLLVIGLQDYAIPISSDFSTIKFYFHILKIEKN